MKERLCQVLDLGLMRDPEEKGFLILDPDTAPTIRKFLTLS